MYSDAVFPAVIVLTEAQWEHFMETMSNPAEPTEAMKQGARMLDELRAQRHRDLQQGGA